MSVYVKKRADKVRTDKGFAFSKDSSVVERPRMIMLDDVAKSANKDFNLTGVFYEKDEAATKERIELLAKQSKKSK